MLGVEEGFDLVSAQGDITFLLSLSCNSSGFLGPIGLYSCDDVSKKEMSYSEEDKSQALNLKTLMHWRFEWQLLILRRGFCQLTK